MTLQPWMKNKFVVAFAGLFFCTIILTECFSGASAADVMIENTAGKIEFASAARGGTAIDQTVCPGMHISGENINLHKLSPPKFDITVGSLIEVLCRAYSRTTKVHIISSKMDKTDLQEFDGIAVDFIRFDGKPYTFLYGEYKTRRNKADDFGSYPIVTAVKGAFIPDMLKNNMYMDIRGRFDLVLSFATGTPYHNPSYVELLHLKNATEDIGLKRVTTTVEYKEGKKQYLAGEFSTEIQSINMLCVMQEYADIKPLCRMEYVGRDDWQPGKVSPYAGGHSAMGQGYKLMFLYNEFLDAAGKKYSSGQFSYKDHVESFNARDAVYYNIELSKFNEYYMKHLASGDAITKDLDERFFRLYKKYMQERKKVFLEALKN